MPDELSKVRPYRTRLGGQRRKIRPEDVDLMLLMYDEGDSINELCQFFEVAPSTLYTYLRPYLEIRDD